MNLPRHALSTLLLFVGAPLIGARVDAGTAQAAIILGNHTNKEANGKHYRVLVSGADGDAATRVDISLRSEAGVEDLPLVESDAWLHGSAPIAALPAASDELALTLYDADSAALISFSGRLGADGSVTLVADAPSVSTDPTGCTSRTGCEDGESRGDVVDIELLAADVYPDGDAWVLSLDVSGADAYAVAYADLRRTPPCDLTAERGICLVGEPLLTEIDWDDVGAVWEAEAGLDHEGIVDVKVKARDAAGDVVASEQATLGQPWLDDGEGVTTLGTDGDPLTTVALHRSNRASLPGKYAMDLLTVVSEGWALGEALPTHAEVELKHGATITVPVNSYQRRDRARRTFTDGLIADLQFPRLAVDDGGDTIEGVITFEGLSVEDLGTPVCSEGICVVVVEAEDGGYDVSLTAYGDDATALPDEVHVTLAVVDAAGAELGSETAAIAFDDEITAVFASEVGFTDDPVGLDLAGTVSLLGKPNRGGRQDKLAGGTFYGTLGRDGDGDLALGGSHGGAGATHGDFVGGGEAVLLTDREGAPLAPPAIQYGNGSGTKNATATTSARPELL